MGLFDYSGLSSSKKDSELPMITIKRSLLASLTLLSLASSAQAAFHFMRISEALGQWHGDPRIQFVELTMASLGQNFVAGHKIIFQDAAGAKTGEVMFTRNVMEDARGSTILVGTAAFEAAFDVTPDLLMPEGLMAPFSGRVCFDTIDCLAYGNYTGSNGNLGTPASGFPVDGDQSLTIKLVTFPGFGNNSTDYELRTPTPKNNAGRSGTVPAFNCFFTDALTNLDNWDQPTASMGIDLNTCQTQAAADGGTVGASAGVLSLKPGSFDFPGLGNLGITGLKNSVARPAADENYRLRFVMRADPGIKEGAVFVRQHYAFDEGAGVLDPGSNFGLGMSFSFDDLNNEPSDHVSGLLQTDCFNMPPFEGKKDVPLGTFKMTSNTDYAVVMDVDGDDVQGPLTLQVKLYPAGSAEPISYLGTFKLADIGELTQGKDHSGATLDHVLLLTTSGSSEASLNFSALAICPIPRNQKHVRCLSCMRREDGSVVVTWDNPADAENQQILIRVNGGAPSMVTGTATTFTITSPPVGPLSISVTNYSGIAATCSVCANQPPEAIIAPPESVVIQEDNATFAIDSSASTDGDDDTQTLSRFWEIVSTPPGANASIEDPAAVKITLIVDAAGDYKFRLTLRDSGCEGDTGQATVKDVTVTVSMAPTGGLQKHGDENQDGNANISDAVSLLNYLFLGTNPSLPCGDGTANDSANIELLDGDGDKKINLTDAVRFLGFLFLGGLRPVACTTADCLCIRIANCPNVCQ